jgi:hypothetical protein
MEQTEGCTEQGGGNPSSSDKFSSSTEILSACDSDAETVNVQPGSIRIQRGRQIKNNAAAARSARAANLNQAKKKKADDELLWADHAISQPDFEPETIGDSIFAAATLILDGVFPSIKNARKESGLHERQLSSAVKFIRKVSPTLPAVSDNYSKEEFNMDLHSKFIRWHKFESKRGPKIMSSALMLRCLELVEHQVHIERKFGGCTTSENFFREVVTPCFQAENAANGKNPDAIPELSTSKKRRLFITICPEVWRGKGKDAIAARMAAMANPCGAISMAVMWPIMTANVNPRNYVWFDTVTHYANHEAPSHVKLPKGSKAILKSERRGPIFDKNDDKERSVGINIGMVSDKGLLCFTVHICDRTIDEKKIVRMSDLATAMFQPYSAASERQARENVANQANGGAAAAEQPQPQPIPGMQESLAMQCARMWVNEVMIPAIRGHRDSLVAEAIRCGTDPETMRNVLTVTDGEQAPLYAVLKDQAEACRADGMRFGKSPCGHSGNICVPDCCGGFVIVHKKFRDRMRTVTEAEVIDLIRRFPGVANAIRVLDETSMDPQSKSTFRKALALSHEIVMAAITPNIVNDGHRVTGLHPFERNKMMSKMWPAFKTLTIADTAHVNRLIDGPFDELGRQQGWVKRSQIQELIKAKRDTAITFPNISANFDNHVLNRQDAVNLSHEQVLGMFRDRMEQEQDIVVNRQQRILSAQELNRRALFRSNRCEESRTFDESKQKFFFKCRCGGKWQNGVDGFKSHETSRKHEAKYPPDSWNEGLYPVPPAAAPAIVNAANAENDVALAPGVVE